MEDVHARQDERGIAIDQVGIRNLRYPVVLLDRDRGKQQSIATLELSVNLPHNFKGTHMSRFVEILDFHSGEFSMHTLPSILRTLQERLQAESARVVASFPYFMERVAPVSGSRSQLDYQCTFESEVNGADEDFVLGVAVPVTTVCPCSKEISDYGAHNQRGIIDVQLRTISRTADEDIVWIEEVVEWAEASGSAPLYPLLKRVDERFVTMQAYDNPVFVEDVVRNVALRLQADPRIAWFKVEALNNESIHNHDAFARVEWKRD